jgi:uncharacterized protein (TIGR03435 family)
MEPSAKVFGGASSDSICEHRQRRSNTISAVLRRESNLLTRPAPMPSSAFVRLAFAASICGAIVLTDRAAHACTAFCAANRDQVLVGNNEDYVNPRTKLWFVPAEDGAYGRMYVGFDDLWPQGGMNERGLWFDGFAAPPIKVDDSGLPRYQGNLVDKAMAECATVEEVVKLFRQYDRRFLSESILMFADASGDAVSIEADAIVRKRGPHFVQANFHQSRGREGGSLPRFNTATSMLADAGDRVSVDLFRRILAATHQSGGAPTLYSNIYELRWRTMVLFYFHDFDHAVQFDLAKELSKGAHVLDIPALFPRNAAAEAFAARNEAQRRQSASVVPAGLFMGAVLAVPLLLLGLAVYGWARGGREIRIAISAAVGAVVMAVLGGAMTLRQHRQASPGWVEFSIGPSAGNSAWINKTLVRSDGLTLRQALATAYDVPAVRLIAPDWISGVGYSINASVPPEAAASFRSLLREELEGRLGLKTHTELRPFDVFVLTASPSSRLEHSNSVGLGVWIHESDVQIQDGSMKDLAEALQGILRKPVVNETGLAGTYNFRFEWTANRVESVTAVLSEKFGLQLSPARRDLEALVVDDIQRDPALVLLEHVGRITAPAPASFRREVSRILSVH